jgi:subtilisin family serine protease
MAKYRHFLLKNTRTKYGFTTTITGRGKKYPPPRPERKTHAEKLLSDLERAERKAKARQVKDPTWEGLQFIPMLIDESSDSPLQHTRLENPSSGIRIVSAKEREGRKEYVVAVPDSEVHKLAKKFRDYRDKDTAKAKPRNEPLASSIGEIDSAELEDYWTDASEVLPKGDQMLWWEVWLDTSDTTEDVEKWFRETAGAQNVTISSQQVRFPDHLVILSYTSLQQWRSFPGLLKFLAEFRKANVVAGEFTRLPPSGQAEFINDLLSRTTFAGDNSVRVCILDTGVNRGHPLLEDSLSEQHVQAWDDDWGSDDHDGHGTEMAGVCLFGPLGEPLYNSERVQLLHRLESVKMFPRTGENDPPDYGPITVGSMAIAERVSPQSQRVFCMAVTASADDQWRPTLWSAAIDQAASGVNDELRRLLIISAGNLLPEDIGKNYPVENHVSSVEDPSQSWNALTVGGYTNLAWIQEKGLEGYTPIAKPGTLSPGSRTSLCWGDVPWPYKPDVVFEGGNYASDGNGLITDAVDLQILTTQSDMHSDDLLGTTSDTSAATAQAARMAAILQAEYPAYWPETIRGLVIHSAEWTPQMREEFPYNERKNRLRIYGMGVPDLERARRSASGFTTMAIQDELQPFAFASSGNSTHEMHIHDLPILREVLEALGNTAVRMRVTLSYFIEPNPPRRGYVACYQYASHGLRFSVRRPQETPDKMRSRLSRHFWEKDENGKAIRPVKGSTVTDDRSWDLGPEKVSVRGSVHSDCWSGTAAQLASSNLIAVYPVTGWWRYRRDREIVERNARYSLIVSISTKNTKLNLYSMVEKEIETRIEAQATRVMTRIES